jgi:NDP-sugar pyrophosphorylase family protein
MKVDHVLILAAGKGTRMGEIGTKLPKVLWPIYEKSILELEVLYARNLGFNNIYINLFNYADKILSEVKGLEAFEGVQFLIEKEKLDIGGAVHNLAREVGYKGNLLILNSDQFIMIDKEVWEDSFENFEKNDHLLFSYNVNSNDKYNAMISKDGKLFDIIDKNEIEDNKVIETYTGMSLIDLSKLDVYNGESNFFESVANYKKKNISVQNIKKSKYWDFGTIPRYWKSIFSILEKYDSEEPFINFLKDKKAIIKEKVFQNSYASHEKNCINLTDEKIIGVENSIILKKPTTSFDKERNKIIWNDLVQYY